MEDSFGLIDWRIHSDSVICFRTMDGVLYRYWASAINNDTYLNQIGRRFIL